mgnify:CR=1 FL=1
MVPHVSKDKWSYFPSAALAWDLKQENFLKENSFIDQLKLRLGYGSVGNQAVEAYRIYSKMTPVTVTTPNGSSSTAYKIDRPAAPFLKWERNDQFNVGVDFGILNGRVRLTADWYSKLSKDILLPENMQLRLQKHMDKIREADLVLVFSCGVGVQTIAEYLEDKMVCAACDTYPVPGFQGVTPLEYKCDQCGECYLNLTGGICPITACSKSLVNGQCGGSKNGKCEVDSEMECGWGTHLQTSERDRTAGCTEMSDTDP